MKLYIAEPAQKDLERIEAFIAPDNPNAAIDTVLRVLEGVEYLATHPTMGRKGRVPKTRELVISGTPFVVVYQIAPESITVLRVLHGARKWPH